MTQHLRPLLTYLVPVLVAGALAHVALNTPTFQSLNPFQAACARPVTYAVTGYDARFGISEEAFTAAITEAAALWNTAAGKTVLSVSDKPAVTVSLLYDERQEAIDLGQTIGGEQSAYDAMKESVDALSARFVKERTAYESEVAAFERAADAYEAEVQSWNEKGGAPPEEYAELEREKRSLERRRVALNRQMEDVNALADEIQGKVRELNALADETNEKVNEYNKTLGHDFDQGNYVEDDQGRRITIFTFEDTMELKRVLAHEFGHALGIGHVEDAGSIMYSYNIGNLLRLSEEDISALKEVCEL